MTTENTHSKTPVHGIVMSCIICGRPVDDYVAEYCCDGHECGCYGRPTEPCVCSSECESAVFDFIGCSYDVRRQLAGIKVWET